MKVFSQSYSIYKYNIKKRKALYIHFFNCKNLTFFNVRIIVFFIMYIKQEKLYEKVNISLFFFLFFSV